MQPTLQDVGEIMSKYHIHIVLNKSDNKDSFIPTSLFQHLPVQTPRNTARQINPKQRDYRYGPIRLDWLDFEGMNARLIAQRRGEHLFSSLDEGAVY